MKEIENLDIGHGVFIGDDFYEVVEIRDIFKNKVKNTLIDLRNSNEEISLRVEENNGVENFYILYPHSFKEQSRIGLLESEILFMFEGNPDKEDLSLLKYKECIIDKNKNDFWRRFEQEDCEPHGEILTKFVEYIGENCILLFVEVGCVGNKNGGWIEFYFGEKIERGTIKFLTK